MTYDRALGLQEAAAGIDCSAERQQGLLVRSSRHETVPHPNVKRVISTAAVKNGILGTVEERGSRRNAPYQTTIRRSDVTVRRRTWRGRQRWVSRSSTSAVE